MTKFIRASAKYLIIYAISLCAHLLFSRILDNVVSNDCTSNRLIIYTYNVIMSGIVLGFALGLYNDWNRGK